MHRSKLVFTLLATLAVALVASQSHAQTLTTIASFNSTTGAQPYGDLTLVGSTFYGMTATNYTNLAGPYGQGTVFSLPLTGGTPTTLASFNETNGGLPYGSLTLSADGSTLYGMATFGGVTNNGTIFSLPVTGGTPTVLASFNNTDGGNPYGSLTLIGSNLYGMTSVGGAHGDGTIFSIPVTGGTPDDSNFVQRHERRRPEWQFDAQRQWIDVLRHDQWRQQRRHCIQHPCDRRHSHRPRHVHER